MVVYVDGSPTTATSMDACELLLCTNTPGTMQIHSAVGIVDS